MYNHNARFIAHKNAITGVLKDNPIHEDIIFAAKAAGFTFVLNVVLNGDKEIIASFAIDTIKVHEIGCKFVSDYAETKKETTDIVVVPNGGYPLDQNIYQTVKGMPAAARCINEAGVMIVISSCIDGHGGESFFKWFKDNDSPDVILNIIETTAPEDMAAEKWE